MLSKLVVLFPFSRCEKLDSRNHLIHKVDYQDDPVFHFKLKLLKKRTDKIHKTISQFGPQAIKDLIPTRETFQATDQG